MLASSMISKNNKVILVEKNEKLGKKLYITGKGRCNVTNDCAPREFLENVVTNAKFMQSAIYGFTSEDTMAFLEENGLSLTMEPRLIEQNFGEFEGHEYAKHHGVFHEAQKQFACDYNGGESMLRLGQRIYNLIDELKVRSEKENKTFLLVTHGGIARMVHSYFNSETNEEFSSTNIANCEVREYTWE